MAKKSQPLERISGSLFDSLEKSETIFNEGNYAQETAIENKRLSVWAILSAVFGALGFFALVNLGFLVFAFFGFFASIVAFIAISRMGGELQGKKIAALGLTLSLAAVISGPLRSYVYERAFNKQADQFVKAWFEAVKNEDWGVAHQMTQPYWGRAVFATHQDEVRYWRAPICAIQRSSRSRSWAIALSQVTTRRRRRILPRRTNRRFEFTPLRSSPRRPTVRNRPSSCRLFWSA